MFPGFCSDRIPLYFRPNKSKYPKDATIAAQQFAIRDFVVGTTTAVYGSVTTDGTEVKVRLCNNNPIQFYST